MQRIAKTVPLSNVDFEYPVVELDKCKLEIPAFADLASRLERRLNDAPGKGKSRRSAVAAVIDNAKLHLPDGRVTDISRSFVSCLCNVTGVSPNVFNVFTPPELFNRYSQLTRSTKGGSGLRLSLERLQNDKGDVERVTARAIKYPNKFFPEFELAKTWAEKIGDRATKPLYCNGSIDFSLSAGRNGTGDTFRVADNDMSEWMPRTFISMPVDGNGQAHSYVEMIRMICTNGATAMSRAFRTTISLADVKGELISDRRRSAMFILNRFVEALDNSEDMAAVINRLRAAAHSHMSMREFLLFFGIISRVTNFCTNLPTGLDIWDGMRSSVTNEDARKRGDATCDLLQKFTNKARSGDVAKVRPSDCKNDWWSLMMLETAPSQRKAAQVRTQCTVYDGLNFLTEAGAHLLPTQDQYNRRRVAGLVGDTLCRAYDCENSVAVAEKTDPSAIFSEMNAASVAERAPKIAAGVI